LAAAIKAKHRVECQLIEGSGGVFDVRLDGKLIYSKQQTGRFPEDEEVLSQLGAPAR
jgi:selT/selW/selH-like putative selenoprotein